MASSVVLHSGAKARAAIKRTFAICTVRNSGKGNLVKIIVVVDRENWRMCDCTEWRYGRRVYSKGLYVAQTEIGFSIKHHKNSVNLIMPELEGLFRKFMDNEFYTISDRFHQIISAKLLDTKAFKKVLDQTKLFCYECSDTNDNPSKRAREVIEILAR